MLAMISKTQPEPTYPYDSALGEHWVSLRALVAEMLGTLDEIDDEDHPQWMRDLWVKYKTVLKEVE